MARRSATPRGEQEPPAETSGRASGSNRNTSGRASGSNRNTSGRASGSNRNTGPSEPEPSAGPSLLEQKLEGLPTRPGCYLFLDGRGAVLYVGKAKSLRSRVRSYFQEGGSDARYFVPVLRRIAADLETVVTSTEKEAAVLENQLIKQHQPRFNVKLRDDKDFLCLRVDTRAEWPRVEPVRRPGPDGARYFGPFHSATAARRTLHLVNKHWKLRTCSNEEMLGRKRPCLQYQIKRCPAPCVYDVDAVFYGKMVESLVLFLSGRHDELTGELERDMKGAAAALEFERAAIYRDQLRAVEKAREAQRVVSVRDVDQDVIGLYREGPLVEIVLLQVRAGRVNDALSFSLRGVELPDDEALAGFLSEYYDGDGASFIPDEVLLPLLPESAEGVAEWLTDKRQALAAAQGARRPSATVLAVPQRAPRAELLRMALDNAAHAFAEKQRAADDVEARLEDLRQRLRLESLPRRIECCDISHMGGGDVVGSVVRLSDGVPDKKGYRTFHVKGVTLHAAERVGPGDAGAGGDLGGGDLGGAALVAGDDYAAMYEVLARRFRRARAEGEDAEAAEGWELPDLLVVDGGRGQLAVALAAARDLGLHDLPIVGLAKERESAAGERVVERVYLPRQKNGIELRPTSAALFLLARVRDEAHRFANRGRKQLGTSRRFRSVLDDVKGLGKAKNALLRELGSLEAIKAASDAQVLAVGGVTRRHLTALRKVFPSA